MTPSGGRYVGAFPTPAPHKLDAALCSPASPGDGGADRCRGAGKAVALAWRGLSRTDVHPGGGPTSHGTGLGAAAPSAQAVLRTPAVLAGAPGAPLLPWEAPLPKLGARRLAHEAPLPLQLPSGPLSRGLLGVGQHVSASGARCLAPCAGVALGTGRDTDPASGRHVGGGAGWAPGLVTQPPTV